MPLRVKLVGPLGKNPLVAQLVKPKIPARARSRISAVRFWHVADIEPTLSMSALGG
jgi:hypothetical protein